jgi:hypothetical protein
MSKYNKINLKNKYQHQYLVNGVSPEEVHLIKYNNKDNTAPIISTIDNNYKNYNNICLKNRIFHLDKDRYARYNNTPISHYIKGTPPGGKIFDHINGVRNDDRVENLRIATLSENQHNQKIHEDKNKTSKYKGVHWNKKANKWCAQISLKGIRTHLGLYKDEIDGAIVYDLKAIELFKEYAKTNFPIENYK